MIQTDQLKDFSRQAVRLTQQTLQEQAKAVISAEERLRMRVQATLRVAFATVFFFLSGLVSLGANVTVALAKKSAPDQNREKKQKGLVRAKVSLKNYRDLAERKAVRPMKFKQVGKASWYGGKFHNRKTASGKKFDTYALMAAHKTLPFGTKLLVTNLSNKKTCVVEVADRGPYAGGRIIDLSYAAASELGFVNKGVAEVKIAVLQDETMPSFADKVTFTPVFDVTRGNVPVAILQGTDLALDVEE